MSELFKIPRMSTPIALGLFFLRLVAGLAFMYHGYGKILTPFSWMGSDAPIHGVLQFLAALAELGGGMLWMLGLLMPLGSLALAITMLVATLFHVFILHDPFVASTSGEGSYELALLYFCIALLFLATGPGKFSLDHLIFGEKTKK